MAKERNATGVTSEMIAGHNRMVAEIRQLVSDLEDAATEFYKLADPQRDDAEHQRRLGAASAIHSVVTYLEAIGAGPRLHRPLVALWEALRDAEHGIAAPLTKPKKYTGGPRGPIGEELLKVRAAVTATLLHDSGMELADALRTAAMAAGNGITASELEDYRKRLTRQDDKRGAPEVARNTYDRSLTAVRSVEGRTGREKAEGALTLLRQTSK